MHRGDIAVMHEARKGFGKSWLVKLLDAADFTVEVRTDKHNRGIASGENASVADVKRLPAECLIVFEPGGSVREADAFRLFL